VKEAGWSCHIPAFGCKYLVSGFILHQEIADIHLDPGNLNAVVQSRVRHLTEKYPTLVNARRHINSTITTIGSQ
jgi:hypothetical protein